MEPRLHLFRRISTGRLERLENSELSRQKVVNSALRAADDGLLAFDQHGALKELFVLHENVDDGLGIVDVVVGIELELFEFGILAHEIFDRIFKGFHNLGEFLFTGRSFDVNDDFVIDSEFLGDRQGIIGRTSMIEMVDGDFGHAGNLEERFHRAIAI